MTLIDDLKDPFYFQVGYLNQTLHKKQIEVVRSRAKHKIVCCGRRAGKTQMIAGEGIRGGVLKIYKRQIVVSPIFKQSMIVLNKMIELLQRTNFIDVKKILHSPYPKIIFKNGCEIDFGSADRPDSLRGEAYNRIFLDEAGFIKDEAMPAIKPLGFDTGAPVWKTSTPWSKKSHFYSDWCKGLQPNDDYGSFKYDFRDNPYITDEGKREIEKQVEEYGRDSIYVKTEIFGEFPEDVDAYFSLELLESSEDEFKMIRYGDVIGDVI